MWTYSTRHSLNESSQPELLAKSLWELDLIEQLSFEFWREPLSSAFRPHSSIQQFLKFFSSEPRLKKENLKKLFNGFNEFVEKIFTCMDLLKLVMKIIKSSEKQKRILQKYFFLFQGASKIAHVIIDTRKALWSGSMTSSCAASWSLRWNMKFYEVGKTEDLSSKLK